MIPWEIYSIITHDPSSHVNLPLGLPEQCDRSMHGQLNKWHKKKKNKNKNKKKTLHTLTHGAMRGCGLTSMVVCINYKTCAIRERNVTIRSEI